MADISANLFPDYRLAIQGTVYIASLVSAHFLFIKPLTALYNERRKRTVGRMNEAREKELRALELQQDYNKLLATHLEKSRARRLHEIQAGEALSRDVIAKAQDQARETISQARTTLALQIETEKRKLPIYVEEVVAALLSKLGVSALLFIVGSASLLNFGKAFANEGVGHSVVVNADTTWWPYFQFVIYLGVLIYFGKKIIPEMLRNRQESFRQELTVAKNALALATSRAQVYEDKLAQVNKEMDEIFNQYVRDGVRAKEKIVKEAESLSSQILRDAASASREIVERSRQELKKELLEEAIATLEKRLDAGKLATLEASLRNDAVAGIRSLSTP